MPERLYKYLPSKYLDNVFHKGELLFRNLTYFKQYECEKRGDPLEGHHRDNPDNDITITNLSKGTKFKGDCSFLNTTDSDLIYVYCMSRTHRPELYEEFNCDACIEVTDVSKFFLRVKVKLKHLISLHKAGLLHGAVKYYAANKPAEFNIKDPKELAFAKDEVFRQQDEYRLVFGTKKAFKLIQKIVINNLIDFKSEAMKGVAKDKRITIGNMSDIANVKYKNT
ncbi:hypothetical protein KAT63_05445 [Candidatus Parcubacteria bacterium]|jgi:hypothetical protein|nr:hypothetical protein [Candidatus Parcubacteria bacterium]